MQVRPGTTKEGSTAVWCQACGIPYASDTTYCANCAAPLADTTEASVSDAEIPLVSPRVLDDESLVDADDAVPGFDLDAVYPTPPTTVLGRLRKRPRPLSEDEVEAAAAAIIARAREEVANGADDTEPRDALDLLPDLLPDPVVERSLQERQERDRAWIIAGIVCSVLLIICALAFSRYLAGGLPQR
jgi:hypothetical protein